MQQSAPVLTAEQLRALPLFATLAPEVASAVVSRAKGLEVPRGEPLVRLGQRRTILLLDKSALEACAQVGRARPKHA
jgi:hypothetical protein